MASIAANKEKFPDKFDYSYPPEPAFALGEVRWTYVFVFPYNKASPESEEWPDKKAYNDAIKAAANEIYNDARFVDAKSDSQAATSNWKSVFGWKNFVTVMNRDKGLAVRCKIAANEEEIYVEIGCTDARIFVQAEKNEMEVQLTDESTEVFNIAHIRSYMRYPRADINSAEKPLGPNDPEDKSRHFLTTSQRQELVLSIIKGGSFSKKIRQLKTCGFIKQMMVTPDRNALAALSKDFATFRPGVLLNPFVTMPYERIRDYFGEKIAMYFAFVGFYTAWLIPPCIFGILVIIIHFRTFAMYENAGCTKASITFNSSIALYQASSLYQDCNKMSFTQLSYLNPYDGPVTVFFVFFLTMWGTLMCEFWKRKQAFLAWHWGMNGFEENEPYRDEYQVDKIRKVNFDTLEFQLPLKASLKTGTERYYSNGKRNSVIIAGLPMIAAVTVATAIVMIYVKFFRDTLSKEIADAKAAGGDEPSGSSGKMFGISLINTISLIVFNVIFKKLSVNLNNLENWRTETEYEDALILKTMFFQFINSYGALLIAAFWPATNDAQNLLRMQALFFQLLSLQISKTVIDNFKEVAIPSIAAKVKDYFETKGKQDVAARWTIYDSWANDSPYEGTFDDYAELILQFGYVTLFAAGFPLGPVIAFINNVFEIRIDGVKLTADSQRPVAKGGEDIGNWLPVLEGLVLVAIIANAYFMSFTSYSINMYPYNVTDDTYWNTVFYICSEKFLILFMVVLKWLVPDVPRDVQKRIARAEFVARKREFDAAEAENSTALREKRGLTAYLPAAGASVSMVSLQV